MDSANNVIVAMVAVAAAGFSIGGLVGLLIAHLHYRARARLQERINQAAPSLWRA